jgi:hypothetical protein
MIDERLFNRLQVFIKKAYYGYSRYNFNSTFAYLYFEGDLSVVDLGKFLRVSDHFIQLDENHYFIDFAYTKQNDAFKASQNLLVYLDKHLNNTSACVAIDTFDVSKSATVVFNRLQQILDATRKKEDSRIEDEKVFNELF